VQRLRQRGHEVIEVEPYRLRQQHDMVLKLWYADGGRETKRVLDLSGEPWVEKLGPLMWRPELELSVLDYWDLNVERDAYRKGWSDWWRETNTRFESGQMDGLLCSGLPMTAVPLTAPDAYDWESTAFVVPLVDHVGGIVPVLQADKALDPKDHSYMPRGDLDRELWEMYDPEAFEGGWSGVQVVGRRFQEEEVLKMMKTIDMALRE